MEDRQLEAYLLALKNANTDNEKFAALLMVSKVTKNETCDIYGKKQILEAIGPKFFSRLLKTKTVPEGCPDIIYKTVALSILSALCTEPDVACSPALLDNVTSFNGIILTDTSEAETMERQLVDDTYECYSSLCQTQAGRDALERSKTVSAFSQAVVSEVYGCGKAYDLLLYLLEIIGPGVWEGSEAALALLLRHLAQQFKDDKTATKFKLCKTLVPVLNSKPTRSESGDTDWQADIVTGIDSMLRSKLGSSERELALRLAATVIDVCGVECLLPPCLPDSKLFLLIIHLCCVEVRMVLEDPDINQASAKGKFLTLCYSQLEMIIGHLTASGSPALDERQIVQLHSAMVGAYSAVLHFLRRVAETPVMQWQGVVLATVRVLAAWLAEETTALKDEVYDLLPFILQISKMCIPPDDYVEPSRRLEDGDDEASVTGVGSTGREDCDAHKLVNNNPDTSSSTTGDPQDVWCNGEVDVTPAEASLASMAINDTEVSDCGTADTACGPTSDPGIDSHSPAKETCSNTSEFDTANTCDLEEHNKNKEQSTTEGCDSTVSTESTSSVTSTYQAELQIPSTDTNNGTANGDQSINESSTTSEQSTCESHEDESKPGDSGSNQSTSDQTIPKLSKLSDLVDSPTADVSTGGGSVFTAKGPETESDLRDLHIRVDILRFLLPGLCHLTAEDAPRAILVREGALSLLDIYMWRQWARFSQHRHDREIQSGLVILCNIFLNLVIVEPRLVTDHDEFSHVLLLLVKNAAQLEFESEHMVLWCHMLTLGLMLMRALAHRTDEFLEKESISQFFQSAIRFLRGTYIALVRPGGVTCLTKEVIYTEIWDQMSQTWFLSMQAFCACIPLYETLPSIMLKVGWIPSLLKTLLQVKGQGVEEEANYCFQLLLTTVANRNKAARTVIKEMRGLDIAKMYKWKDLASILQR